MTTKHPSALARLGIATTSAISYPALVSALAIGITTFTVVPVFAESSFPLDCTHPGVASCDGKDEMTSCDCGSYGICACQPYTCDDRDAGGGANEADADVDVNVTAPGLRMGLACKNINDCERSEDFAICKGKEPDAACTIGKLTGNCSAGSLCNELGADNKYRSSTTGSRCVVFLPPDGGPSPTSVADDEGGCSTSSASASGTVGGLALCFMLGGALRVRALRRRRMRR